MLVHDTPWRYRGAGGKSALSALLGKDPAAALPQAGWRFAVNHIRDVAASMPSPRSRPGRAIATLFIKLAHRSQHGVQCIF
jgi:hypothetical protein